MSFKTITISVKYEEEGTGQDHTIKEKVKLELPIGQIMEKVQRFKEDLGGTQTTLIDKQPEEIKI